MPASSHVLDPIRVTFDDDRAVADASLLLTGTLIGQFGLKALVAGWRHHAFVTNRTGDAVTLDAEHRAHAVVELATLQRLRALPAPM